MNYKRVIINKDIFRPRSEPARTIYDVWVKTAKHRELDKNWIQSERLSVLLAAQAYATKYNLPVPTIEDIERAEIYAVGSATFGADWARKVADIMEGKSK